MLYSYFAYGSNLNQEQMKERVGPIPEPRPAKLTGYKLVFDKYSNNRQCHAANLRYTGNPYDIVEGVVYQLTEEQIKKLDVSEGYRSQNGSISQNVAGYKQQPITLTNGNEVITYIAAPNQDGKPSVDYLKNFLKGRRFLSEAYQQKLLDIEVKEGGKLRMKLNSAPAPAPAPVIFSNRSQENQIRLEDCVARGLQKGALSALQEGAKLTPKLVEILEDPNYKRNNPKTTEALAPYLSTYWQEYLEQCIKQGLQKGALKSFSKGAELTPRLVEILEDPNYKRNNPKTTEALAIYVAAFKEEQHGHAFSLRG